MALRDGAPQVLFDDGKLPDDFFDLVAVDPRQRRAHHVLGQVVEAFDQGAGSGHQKQPFRPTIRRVRTPLDQAAIRQPVEEPGQRDRLQIEHFSEFGLFEPLEAIKPHQHRPLGPGHAELPRLGVGEGLEHSRYIIDREGKFSGERVSGHDRIGDALVDLMEA